MRWLQTGVDRASLCCLGGSFLASPPLQRQGVESHQLGRGFSSPAPSSERGLCLQCSITGFGGAARAMQTGGAGLHSCSPAPAASRAGACFAQKKNPLPFFCIAKRKIKSGREHCFPSSLISKPWMWLSPGILGSSTYF